MKKFIAHIYKKFQDYLAKPEFLKVEVDEPFAYEGGEITLNIDVSHVRSIRINRHKIKVKGSRIEGKFKIPAYNDVITIIARNLWKTTKTTLEYKLLPVNRQRDFSPKALAWKGNEDSQLKKRKLDLPRSKMLRNFNPRFANIKQPKQAGILKIKPQRIRLYQNQIKPRKITEPELNTEQL